jgi:hypothetical protein
MGYKVDIHGKLKVGDARAFYKSIRGNDEAKEFFDFADFNGKKGQDGIYDLEDGDSFELWQNGSLWHDDKALAALLAINATGEIVYKGEDGKEWKYILDGEGGATKKQRSRDWVDE